MTGSKRVALPVHIAARIKMGEEVSAEEITEALALQKEQQEREERRRLEAEAAEAAGRKPIPDSVDQVSRRGRRKSCETEFGLTRLGGACRTGCRRERLRPTRVPGAGVRSRLTRLRLISSGGQVIV